MEEVDIITTFKSVALHTFRCLAARTRTPDEFKILRVSGRTHKDNVKVTWFIRDEGRQRPVSQGDATEKLAHQVAAQVAAADRRVEEASGDTDEEEKDEAHKSSKGHVSEPAVECPTSPESSPETIFSLDMEEKEKEECERSLPQRRTQTQEPQNRSKPENKAQRSRPPD